MKRIFLILITSLALVGCGGQTPAPNPGGGGGGVSDDQFTFDVTWTPQTTVVSEASSPS